MINTSEVNFNYTGETKVTHSNLSITEVEIEPKSDDNLNYLLAPFLSVMIIIFLTISVIVMIHRKRRLDRLRHHLMPFYTFAPGEEEDWETELLEGEQEVQARRV